METCCVSCILQTTIQIFEKLSKTDKCSYQTALFVARKNRPLLKIKNSTISMINLK